MDGEITEEETDAVLEAIDELREEAEAVVPRTAATKTHLR
jgi:hypothetical protein